MKFLAWLLALGLAGTPGVARAQAGDPLAVLVRLLREKEDASFQLDLLRGMSDGLRGQRNVPMPADWGAVEAKLGSSGKRGTSSPVRSKRLVKNVTFGHKP